MWNIDVPWSDPGQPRLTVTAVIVCRWSPARRSWFGTTRMSHSLCLLTYGSAFISKQGHTVCGTLDGATLHASIYKCMNEWLQWWVISIKMKIICSTWNDVFGNRPQTDRQTPARRPFRGRVPTLLKWSRMSFTVTYTHVTFSHHFCMMKANFPTTPNMPIRWQFFIRKWELFCEKCEKWWRWYIQNSEH